RSAAGHREDRAPATQRGRRTAARRRTLLLSAPRPLGDRLAVATVIPAFDAEPFLARPYRRDRRPVRDSRCAARVHQQNRGAGAARNRGAKLPSAPVLAFLDADDVWPPDHLARLLAVLAAGRASPSPPGRSQAGYPVRSCCDAACGSAAARSTSRW